MVANDADVMRQLSSAEMLTLQLRFQQCGWMPFQPCVDGDLLVCTPLEAFEQYSQGYVSAVNAYTYTCKHTRQHTHMNGRISQSHMYIKQEHAHAPPPSLESPLGHKQVMIGSTKSEWDLFNISILPNILRPSYYLPCTLHHPHLTTRTAQQHTCRPPNPA